MRTFLLLVACLARTCICAVEVDFDFVFVGSSPICVLEALYRSYQGSRVMILEASSTPGGSWRSIDICNVPHVDMGCHQIGNDSVMMKFFESCIGCKLVPMKDPYGHGQKLESADNGLYFSGGCYELMSNLYRLTEAQGIPFLLDHKLDSVYLDFDREIAEINIKNQRFTAGKLVITSHSDIVIENFPNLPKPTFSKHPHLYLLVEDRTPVRFTYMNSFCSGMSRAINLTPFSSELNGTGHQIIVIQTPANSCDKNAAQFFEEFKKKGYFDPSATLILAESYVYEQPHFNIQNLKNAHARAANFFEIIQADAIWNVSQHIKRWEAIMTLSQK